jgi:hypothetical protein
MRYGSDSIILEYLRSISYPMKMTTVTKMIIIIKIIVIKILKIIRIEMIVKQ